MKYYTYFFRKIFSFATAHLFFLKKKIYLILIISGITFCVSAQERWGVVFRPQLNFPVTSFMNKDLRVGNGLELEATYNIMPHLALYGGVHWSQVDTNERFDEDHIDFNQGGYIFGARLRLPLNKSNVGYYLSAGTIYSRIRVTSDTPSNDQKTDFTFNWQLGSGVLVPVFDHWIFTVELRYRFSPNTMIRIDSTEQVLNLEFITISAGAMYRF